MSKWHPDVITLAKSAAQSGKSAQQIAQQLTAATGTTYSRNAVIGKLHRLGIKLKGARFPLTRIKKRAAARPSRRAVIHPKPPLIAAHRPLPNHTPVHPHGLPLEELQANHCRYILNNGHYCANPTHLKSFCIYHYSMCYRLANDNPLTDD